MTLDETYETPRHAKPVRCPRCRRSSLILVFDSRAAGMVCCHCHEKLTALRKDAIVISRDLDAAARGKKKEKSITGVGRFAQTAQEKGTKHEFAGFTKH
jgi:hypothetical protein